VSAQRGLAIVELVCCLTLLTLFGSKYFRVVHAGIPITVKTKVTRRAIVRHHAITASLHFEEGTQLARICTPRAVYV
jgi:hypothetical protein